MPHRRNHRRPFERFPQPNPMDPGLEPMPAYGPGAMPPPPPPEEAMPGMPPMAPGSMQPMPGMPGLPPGVGPSVNAGQPGMPPGPPPMGMPGPGGPPPPEEPEPLEAVDPAVLKALVERGLLDEETAEALLDTRQGYAEAAQTPTPEGMHTGGPFGTYVAAHPLEHLAAGIRRFAGYRQMKKGRSALDTLRRRKLAHDTAVMGWTLNDEE